MPNVIVPEGLSKRAINLAGRRLAGFRADVAAGTLSIPQMTEDQRAAAVSGLEIVDRFRRAHAYPLRMTNANLRHYVREYGQVNVTQRLKKMPTVLDKLCREPSMQLTRMEDIAGVRIVLERQSQVDAVARKLRKNWTIHRTRDYVAEPKASGYRAIHLIALKKGVFVEIQLRTELQDVWANQVERDSRLLRTDFKSGAGADQVHGYYVLVSELLAMRQSEQEPSDEFMQGLVARYRLAQPYLTKPTEPPTP